MKDKHIHTFYCPHGTRDTLEQYVEQAIKLKMDEISFTEHAPLPKRFTDPTPHKDSAMNWNDLSIYLEGVRKLKERYQGKLTINCGLEVDFIEEFEGETKYFLQEYGSLLDDSILSVHFLRKDINYYCLDYSEQQFGEIVKVYGSLDEVYKAYFETVEKSITSDLGIFKPKRIGHITLVEKFKLLYPYNGNLSLFVLPLLDLIKKHEMQLDYNGAGVNKKYCQDTYPPEHIAFEAAKRKIPLIYGSDAHNAQDLGQGLERINKQLL
ncbi:MULTISPECIES: histidinol-phosphatase HisJ [Bacillus]|uniref:histidinol-phosphatase HisJ n=1 Tax=Bacillus TaxID=1386 RepID=UPI000BB7A4CD|nr:MULTISPECIES: histidinol-phosphatase HisJ [Bacillus]